MSSDHGPAQNRVTPLGDIVAAPLRCAWAGNRGVLHGSDGERRVRRSQRSAAWLTCRLEFRGRRVPQWQPGRYTLLFLHDEAVALAAGHRPCGECRHAAYTAFRDAVDPGLRAPDLDRRLGAERAAGPHPVAWADLPAGAFVLLEDGPALVTGTDLRPWGTAGYGPPVRRPRAGTATAITPATSLDVLRGGWPVQVAVPDFHPSCHQQG